MKKHVSQMIKYEKRVIGRAVRSVRDWLFTPYCYSRIEKRDMPLETIFDVIKSGELIEYHRKDGSNRALFRGTKAAKGNDVACVVVNLDKGLVVTAYWNTHDDRHSTLEWSAYDESIDVAKLIRGEEVA